jgi:hypothetical protein
MAHLEQYADADWVEPSGVDRHRGVRCHRRPDHHAVLG